MREYCKRFERVGIFCIPRYADSVSFMFRDLTNLSVETVKDHRRKQYFRLRHRLRLTARHYDGVKTIYNDTETGIVAERQFYGLAGVPHEKKCGKSGCGGGCFSNVSRAKCWRAFHSSSVSGS